MVERRLSAILAADVVGYSRLMGSDEAGTLAQLKQLHSEIIERKITEHRGRIVKLTGDGLLAEFPSVVGAVACAVDMQRNIKADSRKLAPERRLEFRMGVNLGDVIVDGEDIYGDGVNVAARLESVAIPEASLSLNRCAIRSEIGSSWRWKIAADCNFRTL